MVRKTRNKVMFSHVAVLVFFVYIHCLNNKVNCGRIAVSRVLSTVALTVFTAKCGSRKQDLRARTECAEKRQHLPSTTLHEKVEENRWATILCETGEEDRWATQRLVGYTATAV